VTIAQNLALAEAAILILLIIFGVRSRNRGNVDSASIAFGIALSVSAFSGYCCAKIVFDDVSLAFGTVMLFGFWAIAAVATAYFLPTLLSNSLSKAIMERCKEFVGEMFPRNPKG